MPSRLRGGILHSRISGPCSSSSGRSHASRCGGNCCTRTPGSASSRLTAASSRGTTLRIWVIRVISISELILTSNFSRQQTASLPHSSKLVEKRPASGAMFSKRGGAVMRKVLIGVAILAALGGGGLMSANEPNDKKADVAALVKGDNAFAFDLYNQLRAQEGNVFFSPYSISTALAMTYAGARGDTAEEMAKALHITLPPDELHRAEAALLAALTGAGKPRGYQLSIANALWGQQGHGFKEDFLKLTQTSYGAGLRQVDFAGNTEAARQIINAWVAKETQDKIKDLFQKGVLNANTRLVLTNAIYFKGNWASQFKKDLTREEEFQTGTDKLKIPLMHQTARFKYLDADGLQALELPYA